MNSPIYALFDEHFQVDSSSLSTVAFKAIASSIFDRSLRVHSMLPIFSLAPFRYSNLYSKILGPEMEGLGHSMFLPRLHSKIYLLGWILSQDAHHRSQRNHSLIQTCIRYTHSFSPPLSISISIAWAAKTSMPPTSFSSSLISFTQRITAILTPSLRYVSLFLYISRLVADIFISRNIDLLVLYYRQLSPYAEHRYK